MVRRSTAARRFRPQELAANQLSFSFQLGANPIIDYPRILVRDTVLEKHVFEDEEINSVYQVETSVFQSSMFYSGPGGTTTLPNPVTPWRRIAATLLEALAGRVARNASVLQLLDVKLSPVLSKSLLDVAQSMRDADDNSGAFVIVEQVNDWASYRDRWWSQIQRQQAS